MWQAFSLLALGFLLGLEHALEADHVAAITTIAGHSKSLKKAALTGMYWGIGHAFALLLVGGILLGTHEIIPEKIAQIFEAIVAGMLIFLGIKNLLGYKKEMLHTHEKTQPHIHPHRGPHEHKHISFWIGIVHGLAGSAALLLIIISKIQSIPLALTYILIFGIGSIIGMGIMSTLISIPSRLMKNQKIIQKTTGIFSLTIGIFLLVNFFSV